LLTFAFIRSNSLVPFPAPRLLQSCYMASIATAIAATTQDNAVSTTTATATTNAEERAEAASMRVGSVNLEASFLSHDEFPPVEIDVGTFKYVLIEVAHPTSPGENTYLVRGDVMASYHKDAAKKTTIALGNKGIAYTVIGGGRIMHDAANKKILVYGFSYGFPWQGEPRHDISTRVLKKAFPDYESIEWSNEGY
jgi:hypothetical protein